MLAQGLTCSPLVLSRCPLTGFLGVDSDDLLHQLPLNSSIPFAFRDELVAHYRVLDRDERSAGTHPVLIGPEYLPEAGQEQGHGCDRRSYDRGRVQCSHNNRCRRRKQYRHLANLDEEAGTALSALIPAHLPKSVAQRRIARRGLSWNRVHGAKCDRDTASSRANASNALPHRRSQPHRGPSFVTASNSSVASPSAHRGVVRAVFIGFSCGESRILRVQGAVIPALDNARVLFHPCSSHLGVELCTRNGIQERADLRC